MVVWNSHDFYFGSADFQFMDLGNLTKTMLHFMTELF
jgi:hypothetical protein